MIYVESTEKLQQVLPAIQASPRLAVDTEADSLHRYLEKLCLIQVSTAGEDYVFDPLSSADLKGLMDCLSEKPLILHGADFDLRILWRSYQFHPKAGIFDTMLACQILGHKNLSLASLAEKYCEVQLLKTNQKADWSRRPLTDSMLDYAAKDTHYLHTIAGILQKELIELNRLDWLKESCQDLVRSVQVPRPPNGKARWRIRGSGKLDPAQLALLKSLWDWREDTAAKRDKPSFKVLNGDYMIEIVEWKSRHPSQPLHKMPRLTRQLKGPQVKDVDDKLNSAGPLSAEELQITSERPPQRMTPTDKKKILLLKETRKKLAADLGCDPGILAPNAALDKIVLNAPQSAQDMEKLGIFKNWQLQLVAQDFIETLNEAQDV